MPKAIQLSRETVELISDTLRIPESRVLGMWSDILTDDNPQAHYYVQDVLYRGAVVSYLVYNHREMLDDFASIPKGIETHFVPVTQVKEQP